MQDYDSYFLSNLIKLGLRIAQPPKPKQHEPASKMDIVDDEPESQSIYFKQSRKTRAAGNQVLTQKGVNTNIASRVA
jgi:hypothetical protein